VDHVRIGVMSAANIGRKVVMPSILRARETDLETRDGRPLRDAVRLHRSYADLLAARVRLTD
jgi:hypothetical protein